VSPTPSPAEVIAIVPTADRQKVIVRVRIGFRERDQRVLPDMGVKVSLMEKRKGPQCGPFCYLASLDT
jgi:hypothetical protein